MALTDTWIPHTQIKTQNLRNNLSQLEILDRSLFQQIKNSVHDERLLLQKDSGFIRCRTDSSPPKWLFGKDNPLSESNALKNSIEKTLDKKDLIVLIGTAAGYALSHILPIFNQSDFRILVIEPTGARLWVLLALLDLIEPIQSGRLQLAAIQPNVQSILSKLKTLNWFDAVDPVIFHSNEIPNPINQKDFTNAYKQASEIHQQERRAHIQALNELPHSQHCIERVLLINCWQGAPGEVHLKAIQKALNARKIKTGHVTINRYTIERQGAEYRRFIEAQLIEALKRLNPDLVISYGYHGHQMVHQDLFDASNAVWLQAISNIAYFDQHYYPTEQTALIEKNLIPLFKKRGATNPFFIPLMADYVSPQPIKTDRRFPLVFVGNSLGLSSQGVNEFFQRWQGRDQLISFIKQAESQLNRFDSGTHLYQFFQNKPLPQIDSLEEEYAVFRYLLCQGSAHRRQSLLEKIAPYGLVLFGGDWDSFLPNDSPLRACWRGYLALNEEPKIFQFGHLFINIHSVGHVTGPNMRFFNVPGLGGFQISDRNQFENYMKDHHEIVFYSSTDELVEKVRYYLEHPDETEEIRRAGHARIRSEWTYQHWIEQIANALNKSLPPVQIG